ncbi:hypothetical protein D9Q98_001068 [Chlorella vulgaris]|uniref:Thioredoxin domain-containing protein n=1 Tax=Chlorella vulgaris TaxID=3077 RepID=A0A9D4U0R2_CHLVU|nr:hypothetical protein D9Q98_001068 [Chlorella vulgaris]
MGAANSRTYDAQPELASKMAQQQSLIVAFMSPQCGLCASLRPALDQVASSRASELQVAVLNAQLDKQWAPEMLAYNVETVPCFVLLNAAGNAVCKTPPPRSRQQMEAALSEMVQHATQLAR